VGRNGEGEPLLNIGISRTGAAFVVSLVGELDASTAPSLHADFLRIIDDGVTEVICDLASLRYIDSTGLSVLLMGHKALEALGGVLILRFPQPSVRRVLEITGVSAYLAIRSGGPPAK
jgi:anti-sigma B factor antagonist